MIRLLRLLLALIGLAVIVMLALDNRTWVDIVLWPLPFTFHLPMYALFLVGLFVGAILGGAALWLSSMSDRAEARQLRRRVRAIEYQEKLKREADERAAVELAKRKTQTLALAAPRP
ncbi:MAG: LapA family protein [Geminicoccaceae bacterium]